MEQIIVTHLDSSTTKLQSKENVSTITRANQKVELLGADTVEISVESAAKLNFYIGDKITVIGRDYTLNTPAKERKLSERKFVYDMVFEGVQYDLLRVSYSVNVDTTSNEIQDLSGDSLTGDLKMFLDVLLSNANRVFPGKWVLGTYPTDTETKTLTFGDSDNCLSVLQSLCSEGNYNTEFSIGIAPNGVRTLNIGATGNVFPYTFQYGKGKGLYELTREKVSSTNIVTRLSVYGSSRNINTSKYRAFRLCLPSKTKGQSYLESATGIASYGVWEQTKNFDNIYPRREGQVTEFDPGSATEFIDSTMDFDLNETLNGNTLYLIAGASAKIHFNTGNLAGYEFEITNYNHTTKTFIIRPFTDESGYTFPSVMTSAFQPAVGDKYVILDIYLPQSYIDAAEAELQAAGQEYLDKYSQPNVMYGLTVDPLFLKDVVGAEVEANIVWVGDYIPVKDTDLDVDKSIRVKGFTRDLLKDYAYSLTIADMVVTVSTINRVVSDLRDIDNVVRINNLNDPARARKNYLNSQEVLSMIFDQEGDFYTEKIKPLSIDTSMLSVGAKYMQFGMAGTIFQPNYAGAKNRVVYTGGALTHYAILDSSDNPRTWTIGNGDVVLGTDAAYYIYAKCEKIGSNGSILFSTSQIIVESDSSYYHFLIGVVNSVGENNERAIALMYGFSTINGRFIKTGRVQSADGATYFDLDSGQIAGKISFSAGSSGYGNLEDAPDVAGMIDGIEIGGRNLFIEGTAEAGKYVDQRTGEIGLNSAHKVSDYIAVSERGNYVFSAPDKYLYYPRYAYYDTDKVFITGGITMQTDALLLTAPAGAAYIRVSSNGNTGGVLRKFEKGNKPTDWTPAPEDVQAEIDAYSYLKEAMQNSTDIQGGLLSTTLIKLGAVNQSGTWVEKAGVNGAGTSDSTPRLYAGGTLQQAANRIAGQLTNAAKFVVTQGGKIFGMEVELFGSISTAPPGGKRIHLSQEIGAVNIHDETGRIKAAISAEPMPSLSSLLQKYTASANVAKRLLDSTHTRPVGTSRLTNNTTSIVLSELSANHTVTTPPVLCNVQAQCNTTLGEASAYVRARLISENGYITLGSLYVSANSQIGNQDNFDSSTIPSQEISGLAPGTYYIQLYSEVYKKNMDDFGWGEIEIKSPNDVLSSTVITDVSWIFNNGIYLVRDSNNYMYINPYGVKERFENAPDRPGVLASASVLSGGGHTRGWGPKLSSTQAAKTSTGIYRLYHTIGHTDYTVQITPLTSARLSYISTRATTYVDVYLTNTSGTAIDTAFDYCIIGNN